MNIAIMGFGNPVRSDDAVGCKVIEWLQKDYATNDQISILDMGTSAFEMLYKLKGHEQLIIIDGVINSNEPDGTVFKLPASAINASIIDDPMVFLHSLKWDQALSYAKKIMQDTYPENNIIVYLIAISDTKLEVNMSEKVLEGAQKVYEAIKQDLNNALNQNN